MSGLAAPGARTFGMEAGQVCWRNGCQGVIERASGEGCSCHINPPCGDCTEAREFCPVCGWDARDEVEHVNGFVCKVNPADRGGAWLSWKPRPLDPRKIDYRIRPHSNSSQLCEGVYPDGTTRAEVEAVVRGTFGGRFNHFCNGRFEYVAYTD